MDSYEKISDICENTKVSGHCLVLSEHA